MLKMRDKHNGDGASLGDRMLEALPFWQTELRQHHIASLVEEFELTCRWIMMPGKSRGFIE